VTIGEFDSLLRPRFESLAHVQRTPKLLRRTKARYLNEVKAAVNRKIRFEFQKMSRRSRLNMLRDSYQRVIHRRYIQSISNGGAT